MVISILSPHEILPSQCLAFDGIFTRAPRNEETNAAPRQNETRQVIPIAVSLNNRSAYS